MLQNLLSPGACLRVAASAKAGEGIYPVKYELFDVIRLESMHPDVEHGYLSLSFNRIKGRGTQFFSFTPTLTLPHRRGRVTDWIRFH
jgi:hypothetical protein